MRVSGHAGDSPLQQYRLYFLDSAGRIDGASHEFEADNDATAAKLAEAWREGRRIELWRGDRKIDL